jgi:hypothetical protein
MNDPFRVDAVPPGSVLLLGKVAVFNVVNPDLLAFMKS